MVQVILWAGAVRASEDAIQPGDLVELLDDGVHAGNKVISGPNWDDQPLSDWEILDVAGYTVEQVRQAAIQFVSASLLDIDTLNRVASIDRQSLPASVRNRLNSNGRASATAQQVVGAVEWKGSLNEAALLELLERNGRFHTKR